MKFPFQEINFFLSRFVVTSRKGKLQPSPDKINQDTIIPRQNTSVKVFPPALSIHKLLIRSLVFYSIRTKTWCNPTSYWRDLPDVATTLTEGASDEVGCAEKRRRSCARLTELIQQPQARRLQTTALGRRASASITYPVKRKGTHLPFSLETTQNLNARMLFYCWNSHQTTRIFRQPAVRWRGRHRLLPPKTRSVFLFNDSGYCHAPPWSGQGGQRLLPQGFTAQALRWPHSTISHGEGAENNSCFSPAAFQPPLIRSKTWLTQVRVWLIPTETAGRGLRD